MLLSPALDPDEVVKERQVVIEELRMYQDNPQDYVQIAFDALMWPGSPARLGCRGPRGDRAVVHGRRLPARTSANTCSRPRWWSASPAGSTWTKLPA